LIKKLFIEQLNLLTYMEEIEYYKRKKKKTNLLEAFYSILYLYKLFLENGIVINLQIITTNFINASCINLAEWKRIFYISAKLEIILDFQNLNVKNIEIFHYGSYKTKGIYCKPLISSNLLMTTGNFLNLMVTLFLPYFYNRQFLVLPIPTRSAYEMYRNNFVLKKYFICFSCFSFFSFFFPKCLICGTVTVNK